MKFRIVRNDHRFYLDDGFGPFDSRSISGLQTAKRWRDWPSVPELKLAVKPPPFVPDMLTTINPPLLFVAGNALPRILPGGFAQAHVAGFHISRLGDYLAFDLDRIGEAFSDVVDFRRSEFLVVKSTSLMTGARFRVQERVAGCASAADLEARRSRPFPLDRIVASQIALLRPWPHEFFVCDSLLYVSERWNLRDSGLEERTQHLCEIFVSPG